MKNYITVAALLAAGTALYGADVQTATWTGGAGTYSVAQASAASNWNNNQTLDWDSTTNPLAYTFDCGGNVTIGSNSDSDSWLGMYTADEGSWTVSGNTNVTIYGENKRTWTGNITVEAGSSLTIYNSSLQLKDGTYKIDGTLTIGWDIKFDSNASAPETQTFALGSAGKLKTNSRLYTDGTKIKFTGTVDLGSGSTYVLCQRTLFDGESQIRIDGEGEEDTPADITALFNDSITAEFAGLKTYDDTLDADALTAADAGKYFLSTDGPDIVLNYVSAVPEPSAFGLLAGLGALALVASRRRRK